MKIQRIGKIGKFVVLLAVIMLAGTIAASAQAAECPANLVCISREAALKALADADEVKALRAEVKVKDQGFEDLRKELNRIRIEFAEKSGENTALKQNAVSDRAIIDLLLKNVKPRKIGLINF